MLCGSKVAVVDAVEAFGLQRTHCFNLVLLQSRADSCILIFWWDTGAHYGLTTIQNVGMPRAVLVASSHQAHLLQYSRVSSM